MDTSRLVPEPPSRLSSSNTPTKQKQQKQKKQKKQSTTGSSLSILLLLLPLVGGVWAGLQEHHAIVDHAGALAAAAGSTVLLYVAVWLLSFWRTTKDAALVAVTAFTLVLWLIVGVFVASRINTALDNSLGEPFEAEVQRAALEGKGRGTRCVLHLEGSIEYVGVDVSYCEIVDVGDVYVAELHPGALGMRWLGPPTIRKRSRTP